MWKIQKLILVLSVNYVNLLPHLAMQFDLMKKRIVVKSQIHLRWFELTTTSMLWIQIPLKTQHAFDFLIHTPTLRAHQQSRSKSVPIQQWVVSYANETSRMSDGRKKYDDFKQYLNEIIGEMFERFLIKLWLIFDRSDNPKVSE